MTSIVGIKCKDGIVIGADSSATFSMGQFPVMEQPFEKITVIGGHIIVAGTGEIGLGQRFCSLVRKLWEEKKIQGPSIDIAKMLSRAAQEDFSQTFSKQGTYGALVAFPSEKKPCLCEFAVLNFQPELKTESLWYVSMGSAQAITDTFMAFIREIFWSDGLPTVNQAAFAVTWILDHAIRINAGGVNGPIRMAVLESQKGQLEARLLSEDELGEHKQNVEEAKNYLRGYKLQHQKSDSAHLPPTL